VTPSGRATERGNAAVSSEVGAMFDQISGVYDPMNLVISAFQEPRWRRRAVAFAGLKPGGRAIDVASGTGKVAADLHASAGPGGEVLGVDISPGMIGIARRRFVGQPGLTFVVGDAMALPAVDDRFDAATIAFGMRNLPDYTRGFTEMARVVRPGGKVVCLEIARPRSRLARIMRWWFDRIVPLIGKIAGQGGAYAYLVRSVQSYPAPERIAEVMRGAGLVGIRWIGMSGGIVTIHVGTVPPHDDDDVRRDRRRMASALTGAFRSGRHDTAATHDDVLGGETRW
jgi:demethylmenaquinone methyltransferase/2-methoxy-6-polyprenyl-1,4-benzoquinol methylase